MLSDRERELKIQDGTKSHGGDGEGGQLEISWWRMEISGVFGEKGNVAPPEEDDRSP